jgi:hypothetical protein
MILFGHIYLDMLFMEREMTNKYLKNPLILVGLLAALPLLGACTQIQNAQNTVQTAQNTSLPDECTLPDGVSVTGISLDDNQAGEINGTGLTPFSVTVTLNRALVDGEFAAVCYAVRDVGLIINPIGGGVVGILPGQGATATRDESFNLTCDSNGKIAGSSLSLASAMDSSSGERSTKIYVQHTLDIQRVAQIPTGIKGEKSNRIRVSCPR